VQEKKPQLFLRESQGGVGERNARRKGGGGGNSPHGQNLGLGQRQYGGEYFGRKRDYEVEACNTNQLIEERERRKMKGARASTEVRKRKVSLPPGSKSKSKSQKK